MVTQRRAMIFTLLYILLLTHCFQLCCGQKINHNGSPKSSADTKLGKRNCKDGDEECEKDASGYSAIVQIHQSIDDDHNGNVDYEESGEFMRDELQYTEGFERLSIFHGNDKFISIGDLWHAWKKSTVYNWTTDDVVFWLVKHVELPIYVESFKSNSVDGPTLPRLAISDNNYMANVLGVKNAIHRQKISVKAMDLVLFGPPREKNKFVKDLALILLLVVAFGGVWFALNQHRYSKRYMKKVSQRMENLRKAELQLQELQEKLNSDESIQKQENVEDDTNSIGKSSRGLVMEGSLEEIERLRLAEEELEKVREALQEAEQRNKWTAPSELQLWLQLSYETESHYFAMKKKEANNRVQIVKESCAKLRKKRGAFFGPFRMANDNSMDESDQKIQEAKEALEEVNVLFKDKQRRWQNIEKLCDFSIVNNPGKESLLQRIKNNTGLSGHATYRIAAAHMPSLNVDQAEMDEDLPPGYPGPALFYRTSLANGLPRPPPPYPGYPIGSNVRHRPQNLGGAKPRATTPVQVSSSQHSDTGSDKMSIHSDSLSPESDRPVFSLGETSPDGVDGRKSPMKELYNNNSLGNGNRYGTLPTSKSCFISDIQKSNRDSVGNASLQMTNSPAKEATEQGLAHKRCHSEASLIKSKVNPPAEKSQSVDESRSLLNESGQKKQKKKLLPSIFSKKRDKKLKSS